jgi:hypothetical protein
MIYIISSFYSNDIDAGLGSFRIGGEAYVRIAGYFFFLRSANKESMALVLCFRLSH